MTRTDRINSWCENENGHFPLRGRTFLATAFSNTTHWRRSAIFMSDQC